MHDCNSVHTSLDASIKFCKTKNDITFIDQKEYASIIRGPTFIIYVTRPNIICADE